MLFNDVQLELLGRVLDGAALRHRVVASNIANVDTPGYRCREVRFEQELAAALASAGPSAALKVRPRVVLSSGAPGRLDGNNVDLEREYAALTSNSAKFNIVAQLVSMRLAAYRAAIGSDRD